MLGLFQLSNLPSPGLGEFFYFAFLPIPSKSFIQAISEVFEEEEGIGGKV